MNRFTLVIALTSVMGFAGCSLFGDGVADVTAEEAILSDRTVQPSNPAGFEAAIHAAASSEVDTECEVGDSTCATALDNPGGRIFQGRSNIIANAEDSSTSIGFTSTLNAAENAAVLIRSTDQSDSTRFDYQDSNLLEDLHGSDYYYFSNNEDAEGSTLIHSLDDGRSGEVLIQYHGLDNDDDNVDDNYLVAGTWLVQIPDSAGDRMEVFSFALVHQDLIDATSLADLTVTATYGAIGGSAEASGYFFSEDRELSRFLADAVLEVNFADDMVSGQISSTSDYPGQDFTLALEAGDIEDDDNYPSDNKLRSFVFKGATAGEMDGALVDEEWAGTWGGKLYGGTVAADSAPDFVYGTFGATCSIGCTTESGSILGAFIAPQAPTPSP